MSEVMSEVISEVISEATREATCEATREATYEASIHTHGSIEHQLSISLSAPRLTADASRKHFCQMAPRLAGIELLLIVATWLQSMVIAD